MNNLTSTQKKERSSLHIPLDFTKHLNNPRNWKPSELWLYRHERSACKKHSWAPWHTQAHWGKHAEQHKNAKSEKESGLPSPLQKAPDIVKHVHFKRKLLLLHLDFTALILAWHTLGNCWELRYSEYFHPSNKVYFSFSGWIPEEFTFTFYFTYWSQLFSKSSFFFFFFEAEGHHCWQNCCSLKYK